MAIIIINTWNRIGATTNMAPFELNDSMLIQGTVAFGVAVPVSFL